MARPPHKILLADPDAGVLRELSRALRERGYQISVAPDGSRALEIAVLRHPDLVLIDAACKLVDARTFIQILRTNPRTEEIPVIVTGDAREAERMRGLRDGFLRKPFNMDEVLGRIGQIFRRVQAARELKNERDIEGNLKQMGIADLLQVLGGNRRSGCLSLESGKLRGEIHLSEGKPVNARIADLEVEGDKALFRLLGLQEGSFAFVPADWSGPPRIMRGLEDALLEGMRQTDEAQVLRAQLPPPGERLRLAPDTSIPGELHPVTAEVVRLLRESRTTTELLDQTTATDLEVLAALKALLDKGIATLAPAGPAPAGVGPLLAPAQLHALRARILLGRPAAKHAVGKLLLVAESQRVVGLFLDRLAEDPGFKLYRPPTAELLGTWARLELPDGVRVELGTIPGADEARPLWRPFAAGALGAIALDRGPGTTRLTEFLAREERMPVVLLGSGAMPVALKRLLGVTQLRVEPRESLRALLEAALQSAA